MFTLFFVDVRISARPPFKTRSSHINDTKFFLSFLVTIRDFERSERVFSVPGSKIRAKKT